MTDSLQRTIAALRHMPSVLSFAGVSDDDLLALCDAAEAGLRCPPREPDRAMTAAGVNALRVTGGDIVDDVTATWRAMWDVWNSNGPTRKTCPVCKGLAAVGYRAAQTEQTSGETPSASEQANASVPESRTGPLDHQSAAGTNCAAEDGARPSPESARGPAADPIADLCERLRYIGMFEDDRRDGISPMCREAADALERLARENAKWNELHRVVAGELDCDEETWPDHRNAPLAIGAMFILIKQRAERAEAERDALLAIVRAADAMYASADHTGGNPGCNKCDAADDFLAARAKVKP